MSTSTLGGFEREERKLLFDEYLFQRRVLFGLTLSILFMMFVWTVAICSDHWIIVESENGIFVPVSGRYFLWSHTGLWRLCRYALTPFLLLNTSMPIPLTSFITYNASKIASLKKEIAEEPFVSNFANSFNGSLYNTTIDENFKKKLFAEWIQNSPTFSDYRKKYKALVPNINGKAAKSSEDKIIPFTTETINNLLSNSLETIAQQTGPDKQVIVPESLRRALFDGWQKYYKIPYVLGDFVKSMDLSIAFTTNDGARVVLQPPEPPIKKRKDQIMGDFSYKKFENCKYHDFFPTEDEKDFDPSIDDVLVGFQIHEIGFDKKKLRDESNELKELTRSQASFACIGLLIMSMAFVFSMYTFMNPRYMFKRLASGVHLISAACCFCVLRIGAYMVSYEQNHLFYLFPQGAEYSYGYAVYLAWIVFGVNATSCVMFLWYSKKRKGNKAPTEELAMADEPINIGR